MGAGGGGGLSATHGCWEGWAQWAECHPWVLGVVGGSVPPMGAGDGGGLSGCSATHGCWGCWWAQCHPWVLGMLVGSVPPMGADVSPPVPLPDAEGLKGEVERPLEELLRSLPPQVGPRHSLAPIGCPPLAPIGCHPLSPIGTYWVSPPVPRCPPLTPIGCPPLAPIGCHALSPAVPH